MMGLHTASISSRWWVISSSSASCKFSRMNNVQWRLPSPKTNPHNQNFTWLWSSQSTTLSTAFSIASLSSALSLSARLVSLTVFRSP